MKTSRSRWIQGFSCGWLLDEFSSVQHEFSFVVLWGACWKPTQGAHVYRAMVNTEGDLREKSLSQRHRWEISEYRWSIDITSSLKKEWGYPRGISNEKKRGLCNGEEQHLSQVVWCSYLFKNFPQFMVIHIVKGFDIVNKAELDVFLKFSWFFDDLTDVGNLISGSSALSKNSLHTWKFMVHGLLKPGLRILSIILLACEMSSVVQ